ncbi:hypothetical protein MASR2M17_01820 [Aminivibrio sp.]
MTVRREEATRKGWMPMSMSRMAALGASLVREGGEDKVSRGRPDGELGRLAVPDFADHDLVGVLPEDGPREALKVSPARSLT